jgi:D-alanyl-lipoteichoic acid acyltransferase DltB (MBOAT superfamily)
MWHDIELRLLIWGWLIVLFLLPELFAAYLFPQKKWENRPATYRLLCGLGAVANVLMMIMANLVGFAVGLDGLQAIITSIFKDWSGELMTRTRPLVVIEVLTVPSGLAFLITAFVTLFAGIQIMFELRQTEMRKGVSLKC